ncbi:MAG TPA: hypothetical protein VHO06_14245, partial [Polyangia bacterium]|nr:hypothetical protein [Polyangia bacterium]
VGTGGGAATGGAQGGGGQSGGLTCDQIQADYAVALDKARDCSPNASNQCQKMASSELGCTGCPTFVNDTSGLSALEAEWTQGQCGQGQVCPNIACIAPKSATCKAGDGGGSAKCVDATLLAGGGG